MTTQKSPQSSPNVLPTPAFVDRLIAAERDSLVDWLSAMAQLPGNPLKIIVEPFGTATALVCGRIPAEVFNRVIGLSIESIDHIPSILDLYASQGARPTFDLNPYAIPPFWETPNITPTLVKHGFYQGAFHQMLYATPRVGLPELPAYLTIREVTSADTAVFAHVYEQVWGDSTAITVLIDQPQFRCYLALVDNVPAALGVLHVANGIGAMTNALTIPAYRGRGCQTALLQQRVHDAAQLGCTLLVSQCRPGSSSQNNQMRAGFKIAGTKAWWIYGGTS